MICQGLPLRYISVMTVLARYVISHNNEQSGQVISQIAIFPTKLGYQNFFTFRNYKISGRFHTVIGARCSQSITSLLCFKLTTRCCTRRILA
jgi:hypothetical protein